MHRRPLARRPLCIAPGLWPNLVLRLDPAYITTRAQPSRSATALMLGHTIRQPELGHALLPSHHGRGSRESLEPERGPARLNGGTRPRRRLHRELSRSRVGSRRRANTVPERALVLRPVDTSGRPHPRSVPRPSPGSANRRGGTERPDRSCSAARRHQRARAWSVSTPLPDSWQSARMR